jgi:hypothetical protein
MYGKQINTIAKEEILKDEKKYNLNCTLFGNYNSNC